MQGNTFFFDWEVQLMTAIQAHQGDLGAKLASFATFFGEELVLVVILCLMYWCFNKEKAKQMMTAIGACMIWNPLIKNIAIRRRPYFDHPDIKCLKAVEKEGGNIYDIVTQGYSFPSAHSNNAVSVFMSLAIHYRRPLTICLAVVMPLLVGLSRVCLGVHYPTDVLVGWGLGLASVLITSAMWKHIKDRRLIYLIIALTGVPGLFYCTSTDFFAGYGLTLGALLAFMFEEKYVHFDGTRNPIQCVLRLALGGGLYGVLNLLLKLPFSAEWLGAGSTAALLVRLVRYLIIGFAVFGLYPMAFPYLNKLTKKKEISA